MDLSKHIDTLNELLVHKFGASARTIFEDYVVYHFIDLDGTRAILVPFKSIEYSIKTGGYPIELYSYLS